MYFQKSKLVLVGFAFSYNISYLWYVPAHFKFALQQKLGCRHADIEFDSRQNYKLFDIIRNGQSTSVITKQV